MFALTFILRTSSFRSCSRLNCLRKPPLHRNYSKMSSDSHWLSPADRDQLVMELRATGWMEVEDRDAIFKELHFKTFNQNKDLNPHVPLLQSSRPGSTGTRTSAPPPAALSQTSLFPSWPVGALHQQPLKETTQKPLKTLRATSFFTRWKQDGGF
uniref:Uncharacterized protein n=1 Tax=Poecilia mexicana TaxID=48701 RepID=A0A3B3YN89_9TELE